MIKTKIVCTLGPATNDKCIIRKLAETGMDVARMNFSHGDQQEHGRRIELIKEVEEEIDKPIGIILDTQGPEIRTGKMENEKITLKNKAEVIITPNEVIGNEKRFQIKYDNIVEDINLESRILLDDGLIELGVKERS